jgi:glutamate carboxypeptidase
VILHSLAILKSIGFRDYGTLTVVINGDEEISSPGTRKFIERAGAAHDLVLSCEPTSTKGDEIALATSGIGLATLTVRGKSSHAGVAPELGRNAIVELAHQILQTSDLSDPQRRIKFNWTIASGGQTRNVIPDLATAQADVRVNGTGASPIHRWKRASSSAARRSRRPTPRARSRRRRAASTPSSAARCR